MKKDNKDKTVELIVSYGTETIGARFRVKASKYDNGLVISYLICICDLLEGGFSMKCFRTQDELTQLLRLLNSVK